jgi:peptide chain release factor 3
MTFQKDGTVFNLLDTPGHEDFSEDTYRTLTAVDSAIMVIDAAKGIEPQTRKLFEVCRMRSVPIITFVNKVDREGRPVFETLDEVADALALDVAPMSWPVGMGGIFEGVYDFASETSPGPKATAASSWASAIRPPGPFPTNLPRKSSWAAKAIRSSTGSLSHGDLTPVYFGSALKNFGVAELIAAIDRFARRRARRPAARATIDPAREDVTGFVFKVQANMDPQHRTASRSCAWYRARSSAA